MMDDGWKRISCESAKEFNVGMFQYTHTHAQSQDTPFVVSKSRFRTDKALRSPNHPSSRRVLGTRTQPHAFFWYWQIFGTGYAIPVTGVELVCDCRVALFWTGSWYDTWHQFNAHYLFLSRRFPTIIWFWSESDTESCQEWQWQLVGWLVGWLLTSLML